MKKSKVVIILVLCLWPVAMFAQSDSCAITQLPFMENFDALPQGNIGNNACWYSSPIYVDQCPNVFAPYGTVNKYLIFQSSYEDSFVILPRISGHDIGNLMMSLTLKTDHSSDLVMVGVMSDPNDTTTFVPVDTIHNYILNEWETKRVYFNNYADSGQYITIRWRASGYSYYDYHHAYIDDMVIDLAPNCAIVEHLRVADITGHSARISWEDGAVGVPSGHLIECCNTLDSSIIMISDVQGEEYLMDGLTHSTPYSIRVFTSCEDGSMSDAASVSFSTYCPSGGDLVFGDDEHATLRSFPNHKHSVTEEIFTASDLGGARLLNSLSLHCGTANSNRNVAIYLMTVEEETLTHLVNVTSDALKVYDGVVPVTVGWITIPFFYDYYFDGTSNLLVVIHDKTNAYGANSPNEFFCMNEPTGNTVFVAKNDNIGINPMAAANFNGTIYHFRHQIVFGDVCDTVPDCVAPSLNITNITAFSANLEFQPGAQEDAWRVEYRKSYDSVWTVMDTVFASPCIISALQPNTRYLVRIRPICSDPLEHWTTRTFATDCGQYFDIPLPISFEENLVSEEGSNFPNCWYRYSYNGNSKASVVTDIVRAHGGEHFLHFPAMQGGTTYVALPEIAASVPIDSLQADFYLSHSGSGTFEIGVMSEPSDTTTFVPVGEIIPNTFGAYEKIVYPLSNYTGVGRHIAFRMTGGAGDGILLDDLTLDYSQGCYVPQYVQIVNVEPFSADISWQEFGNPEDWEIEYSTSNFSPGNGTLVTVDNNQFTLTGVFTLTGLQANHDYYFYLCSKCDTDNYSDWTNIYMFHTPCFEIDHFPYSEDFSTPGSGTGLHDLPECWGRLVNVNVAMTGGVLAIWYDPGIAVMPRIADYDTAGNSIDIRYLKLDLDVYYYDTADQVTVGVLTDPNDASTFQAVKVISEGYLYSSTYKHHEVYFYGYNGTGRYIAVKNKNASYASLDNFVITQVDYTCAPPVNLTCNSVGSSSTLLRWDAGPVGDPFEFTLQYKQHTSDTWVLVSEHLTGNQYLLVDLEPGTWYDVRIRTRCMDGVYGEWDTVAFRTECFAGGITTIGSGSNVTNVFPVANSANYITRQLFTSEEMGAAGNILSISFKAREPHTRYRDWKIYLQHTSLTHFNHMTVLENLNPTQVFAGTVDIQDGWFTIHFDTPFYYNGTDNVVLTVHDTTGTQASSTNSYYYHQGSGFYASWGAANLTPAHQFGLEDSYSTYCNNVIFTKDCDSTVTCGAPNLFVDSVGGNEVVLSWAAGYQETTWELEYKRVVDSIWTVVPNPTDFQITISNLQLLTDYQVRMRSVCSSTDYSEWITRSFTTGCGYITSIPYMVDFESYIPIGTQNFLECWQRLGQNAYVVANQGISPDIAANHCLQMDHNANTLPYALAVLPRLGSSLNINNLSIVLNMKATNASPMLEIGVMNDAVDTSTFVAVDTLIPTVGYWSQAYVPLTTYSGNGRYVALRVHNTTTGNSTVYVDNLQLQAIPACVPPINFVATNISPYSADLAWTDEGGTTAWVMEYGPTGFTPGAGTQQTVTDTTVSLTGLVPGTSYTAFIQSECGAELSSIVSTAFTTDCGPITPPYYQNFENCGTFPDCWEMEHVSGTRNWEVVTPTSNPSSAHSGLKAILLQKTGYGAETTRLITPPLRLFEVNQPKLRFWHTQAKWSYDQDTLIVLYRTSSTAPWVVLTYYNYNIPQWRLDSLELPNPSNTYQIAFQGTVCFGHGIFLDDIAVVGDSLGGPAYCDTVSLLMVYGVGHDYITLNWMQNGAYDYWGVSYREEGSSTWDTLVTTTHPFSIGGLQENTTYQCYVVNYCEYGISLNSDTITVTTTDVGIADFDRYVKVWPNPTSDVINVECTINNIQVGAVEVVDIYGKVVVVETLPETSLQTRINVSGLASGMYFVRVATDAGTVTKTFVKK